MTRDKICFHLAPAIVASDSALPLQAFKIGASTYFCRPISAGIDRNQPNHDATRLQNRYHHFIATGSISKTDLAIRRAGHDIESIEQAIWKPEGIDVDYFYIDLLKRPGDVF
jgi:hypothetical protein